ncbi:MAG TPA: PQQ-dependent sugar dehydrogenase [bacterium]|nr:PQQ-dependent sugar dehydrogenase [bacterium]
MRPFRPISAVPALLAPLIAGAALLAPGSASGQIVANRIASGLSFPVFATSPPGDASRLFVVEQAGVIRLIKNDTLLAAPFLDISDIVEPGGEQGCLGLAFHPNYASNGWFFVYFIQENGTQEGASSIRRYSVSGSPDLADSTSGQQIFWLDQPYTNHNGGTITFASDGYLYLGLGDGGLGGDPQDRAQNGMSLFGKMLRLDVDGGDDYPGDSLNNYAVPGDNPYTMDANVLDEIWAFGLRNPYRFSFDRQTGDLWIGDVGQDCYEEIHFAPGSSTGMENYGWDVMEGPNCYDDLPINCNRGPCGTGLVDPVHWLSHPLGGIAITGGIVYRGSIAAIQGEYFFGEFYSADIFSLRHDGTAVTDTTDWTAILDPPMANINQITAFAEDADGEMYIVDAGGEIFRVEIDPTGTGEPEIAKPSSFSLSPVRPNPFSGTTRFDVRLDRATDLDVSVFTADGRRVARLHSGPTSAGVLPLEWRPRGDAAVPAGVYFVRAEADGRVESEQVVVLR